MLDHLRGLRTAPFTFDDVTADDDRAVAPFPTVVGTDFFVGGRHRVTFDVTVPEWSMDALAVTTALLADACRAQGMETLLVRLARLGGP